MVAFMGKNKFWAVKHRIKSLKFSELLCSRIAVRMCCKLAGNVKKNGVYIDIFHVEFCSDRYFQFGCYQNKADKATGVGHLLVS